MDAPNRPFANCYWVIPGRFLAGEYPGAFTEESTRKRMDALLEAGIDSFFDLTYPDERPSYEEILNEEAGYYSRVVRVQRFPIPDFGLPSPQQMTHLLDSMDGALAEGCNIYLHCWGGIGRTGTTVGCFLVRQGMSGDEALAQIAKWWATDPRRIYFPRSPETEEQHQFVREWKGGIK